VAARRVPLIDFIAPRLYNQPQEMDRQTNKDADVEDNNEGPSQFVGGMLIALPIAVPGCIIALLAVGLAILLLALIGGSL
jgi:hypothetical protein